MSFTCKHVFSAVVKVHMFEDKPGNGSLEVQGRCNLCKAALHFHGAPVGSGSTPTTNVDGTELRAPVTFGNAPYLVGPSYRIKQQ